MDAAHTVVGIFVGGASRRMGGQPKGLLNVPYSDEAIVVRLVRIAREVGADVVWVGKQPAYAVLEPSVPQIDDIPAGIGPLGGLSALLEYAQTRGRFAVSLACDMPFVTEMLLKRLISFPSEADVVVTRNEGSTFDEPMFARYDAARVAPLLEQAIRSGERSFRGLLERVQVQRWILRDDERTAVIDWDSPEDVHSR